MWLETYKRGRACQETAERSLGGRLWGDVMAKANVMTEPGAGRGAISLGALGALVQLLAQFRFPWASCAYGGCH